MAVEFVIQASNPRALRKRDLDDESLSDAIQTIFPMETERALIVWNHVYIPLGYKYDLSLMTDDIIRLLAAMMSSSTGTRRVCWPSNTFAAIWDVAWNLRVVAVQAQWHRVVGGTESILASRASISVPEEEFLGEWKRPLEVIREALNAAGYTHEQLAELRHLEDVVAGLPRYGHLY